MASKARAFLPAQDQRVHLAIYAVFRPCCLLRNRQRSSNQVAKYREEPDGLAAVIERFGHHRVRKHRQDRTRGEGLRVDTFDMQMVGKQIAKRQRFQRCGTRTTAREAGADAFQDAPTTGVLDPP